MDYKIILLLLLLFLIVLIYKELSTLKDQVDCNVVHLSSQNNVNDKYELKLQSNMDKYIAQIKNISTDNLQQLKKITLLNHQPIHRKKTSNHFTETDGSDSKSH